MIGDADAKKNEFAAAIAASDLAEHEEYLLSLLRPVVWIERVDGPPTPGKSKFGGLPDLPPEYEWPVHSGGRYDFVAQLDFAEMPVAPNGLPTEGVLFLFAATSPAEHAFWRDPGYVTAVYCASAVTCGPRQPPPPSAAQAEEQRLIDAYAKETRERQLDEVARGLRSPDDVDDVDVPGEFPVRFLPGLDLPHGTDQRDDWPFATREASWRFLEAVHEIWNSVHDGARVCGGDQLLGYPGQSTLGYDPTPAGSIPFVCLSSHSDLHWCWHDGDFLHVFVSPEKLAQRDFAGLAADAG